jgi:hypothetical protein
MTPDIETFLNERLTDSALVAWCVQFPATGSLVRTQRDWFTPEQVEQMVQQLVLAANNLSFHRIDPLRLCWVYDRLRIFLAFRPDNECLAVIVENHQGASFGTIDKALEDFLSRPQG